MSDSENKIEDVVSETKSENVEKATKAKKTTKAKKAETVVAAEEVVVEKEAATAAPYITAKKVEEVKKSSAMGSYMAIAAGVLLVVTLTAVTFFQDEYDSVVASLVSITDDATEEADLAVLDTEVSNDEVQFADQIVQANNAYQPFAVNQDRAAAFNEMRQSRRAAFEESRRKHDERMAEMSQLRTAAFERMGKNQADMLARQADMRNRMEVMQAKTQQIQLEMQQKMQAAYNEFHAI